MVPTQSSVGVMIGGGARQRPGTGELRFHVGLLDFDDADAEPRSIDVDFLGHAFAPCPGDPRRLVMFEKHGPGCCVLDIAAGEVVRTIPPGEGRQFYGHGAFSVDGRHLYCTETVIGDAFRGVIAVRDASDFALLGEFPSSGRAPHDCVLVEGGRTMVITNGGSEAAPDEPASVTWVDVQSEALLERVPIPDPSLNAGHLAIAASGALAVVSAPRAGLPPTDRGGITLGARTEAFRTLVEPREITQALLGETLSVAIHEPTGVVGATTPLAHAVTFWELRTGALVKRLRVPSPRGIALSLAGDEFIVNWGAVPRAARVSARTLTPVDVPGNQAGRPSLVTGSHVHMAPRAR